MGTDVVGWPQPRQHPGDRSWGHSWGDPEPPGEAEGRVERTAKAHRSRQDKAETRFLRLTGERFNLHGREGVDGSSQSEGSAKAPRTGLSSFSVLRVVHDSPVWSMFWSSQIREQ